MTNSEYIMSRLNDQALSMLFTGVFNYICSNEYGFVKQVNKAFTRWRRNTYRPDKNFFSSEDLERDRPSVFEWSRVRKDYEWGSFGYRESQVSFQVWLSMQYNPKEWSDYNEHD